MSVSAGPRAWRSADLERDSSWIQTLSDAAVDGLGAALHHASSTRKPLLEMSPDDFPLNASARAELRTAIESTQTGFGLCLLRGIPVERWTVEESLLAY